MGMFDTIIVKRDLPLPEEVKHLNIDWKTYGFQTKDLENCMLEYTIDESGKLFEHIVEREYIEYSEEEKKNKERRPWDLWKEVLIKGERHEEVNHHGTIIFYAYEEFDDAQDFWLDFKAYFVYGKLDKIELLEFKKQKSHKITNQEIDNKRKQEQKQPWNVFKKYASYIGWRWFWRNASRWCYDLSRVSSGIQMFIIRHML
jgi:hypothetical protein